MSTPIKRSYSGLRNQYELHFLRNELIVSVVIWLAIIVANQYLLNGVISNNIPQYHNDAYPLIATIGGTLLGYILTGLSIIILLPVSNKIDELKKGGHYKTISRTYISAIIWLSLLTLFTILGVVVNGSLSTYLFYIILLLVIVSIWRMARSVWILYRIAMLFSSDTSMQKELTKDETIEMIDQY